MLVAFRPLIFSQRKDPSLWYSLLTAFGPMVPRWDNQDGRKSKLVIAESRRPRHVKSSQSDMNSKSQCSHTWKRGTIVPLVHSVNCDQRCRVIALWCVSFSKQCNTSRSAGRDKIAWIGYVLCGEVKVLETVNCELWLHFYDFWWHFYSIFEIFGVMEKYEIQNCKLQDV